jgi:MarR family transcriptional regulator for hemolysin
MPFDRPTTERTLSVAMTRLARVYRRGVNDALAQHGLSDARALPVLQIARMGGGVRQGALAEELGIEGPSLVRLLDQLCAAGLVERRDDPSDGRAKTLHLSNEGTALAAVIEDALRQFRARVMADITDDDLAAALRVFAILETSVGADA